MKHAVVTPFLILLLIPFAGCSSATPQTPQVSFADKVKVQESNHQWVKYGEGWGMTYKWTCTVSNRVDDGRVDPFQKEWDAYVRGDFYGQFDTLDQAEKQVATVFTAKGLSCPD